MYSSFSQNISFVPFSFFVSIEFSLFAETLFLGGSLPLPCLMKVNAILCNRVNRILFYYHDTFGICQSLFHLSVAIAAVISWLYKSLWSEAQELHGSRENS